MGRRRVCSAGEGSKRRSRAWVWVLVGAEGRVEIGGRVSGGGDVMVVLEGGISAKKYRRDGWYCKDGSGT